MDFKIVITLLGGVVAAPALSGAGTGVARAAEVSAEKASSPPSAGAPASAPAASTTEGPGPNAAAPSASAAGPILDLPPETPAPSAATAPLGVSPDAPTPSGDHGAVPTALPRESPVEGALSPAAAALSGTAIGGYGELTLNAPSDKGSVIDLRRFVLYVGHNFNEHLRFYSEVEIEHAISSADDQGEVEVEQAYLDGIFGRRFNLRAGLLLMPVGIVNVYHEPPTFNGVDRPDVDTYVIPSTWREPGLGLFGELATGLRYQLYLVNGFNANGFSAESSIREGHQEGQLAAGRDFGGVARLDYEPVLGTDLGFSAYYATAGNSLRSTVGSVPVTMVEADARTKLGGFSARAEVAFTFIGDTAALNRALAAGDEEQRAAGPVSAQARGGYVDLGYDLLSVLAPASGQNLVAFVRYDYVNTQADVPAGFVANKGFSRQSGMVGLVYRPVLQVGLKLDVRRIVPAEGANGHEVAAAVTWMF